MLLISIKIASINYDRYSQIKKIDTATPHSNVTPKKHPLHTLKHTLLTQKPALEITQSANIIKMITKDTQTELPLILPPKNNIATHFNLKFKYPIKYTGGSF